MTSLSMWTTSSLLMLSKLVLFTSTPKTHSSDVVEWLYHHIEGFQDRREARKYASNLLKAGFIRHTVNKITFSEQCYYIFGDFSDCENCESRRAVSLGDHLGPPQPVTWALCPPN
uniref:Dishevelled segment polarity protein 2 n=1 Tax=Esox lucius TaxID=8010 RepID=A0AAY5L7I0_ESOLU